MNTPTIEVGILSSKSIRFNLKGWFRCSADNEIVEGEGTANFTGNMSFTLNFGSKQFTVDDCVLLEPLDESCSFELFHVIIGVQFHWEREETQRFTGKLKLFIENDSLTAINTLPLEDYLLSVISSEMNADSSIQLLKAHAVTSRSWLLAQMEKGKQIKEANPYQSLILNEEGYIRWYDREDHAHFDVCADDHCQRYQGITKISSKQVYEALQSTVGEVLMCNNQICDARFYKCCGGSTEAFENVWEPVNHPYLTQIIDNTIVPEGYATDLTKEENARAWILSRPPAYCNTENKQILSQILNDYDQETPDFYRWETELAQPEIKSLLLRKIGIEIGDILDLIPVERGVSGRLIRLQIVGSTQTITIGKELEIRKALSESHLYSSAFIVEKTIKRNQQIPSSFTLRGAGWGHGVGLCQIGAAVMGVNGYSYQSILKHYFPQTILKKIY